MTRDEALFLIPYIVSLFLSVGVLAYTWNRRHAQGAIAFTWYALGQTTWIAGFIFELISVDISIKIFWDGFHGMGSAILKV